MVDEKKETLFGLTPEPASKEESKEELKKESKNDSIEKSDYPADVKDLLRRMDKLVRDHGGVLSNMPLNSEYWSLQAELSFKLSTPRVFPETMTRELREALKSAVPTSTVRPLRELLAESQKDEPLGKKSLEERLEALKNQEKSQRDYDEHQKLVGEEREKEQKSGTSGIGGPNQPAA